MANGRGLLRGQPLRHFFFQAEDGIRDGRVTEVQTCALPISRAPYSAAMRAARTPPEPPPITKRSTSWSAILRITLHIVSALFHLGAHTGHDFFGEVVRPLAGIGHALVKHYRLLGQLLLTERRLVEGQQILQF